MNGRVLVVTGASAGIGAEVARRAAAAGASVVLAARSRDKLEAVAVEAGSRAFVVPTDVTVRAEVDALVRAAIDRFGHIDVWVNNAGRGIARATSELSDEDVDAMITVNVKSALYGMQAVLPHFKQRGEGQIVNVSSMLGRVPFAPFRSAYCAAKHALNALTACLRQELRATHPNIVVTTVSPGVVATDFGLNALGGGPDSRSLPFAQPPGEVADVILDAIRERRIDAYTMPQHQGMVLSYFQDIAAAEAGGPFAPKRD